MANLFGQGFASMNGSMQGTKPQLLCNPSPILLQSRRELANVHGRVLLSSLWFVSGDKLYN